MLDTEEGRGRVAASICEHPTRTQVGLLSCTYIWGWQKLSNPHRLSRTYPLRENSPAPGLSPASLKAPCWGQNSPSCSSQVKWEVGTEQGPGSG